MAWFEYALIAFSDNDGDGDGDYLEIVVTQTHRKTSCGTRIPSIVSSKEQ
jgi:hypothetical protein